MKDNERRLDAAKRRIAGLTLPQDVVEDFGKYRDDPVGFVTTVLGGTSARRRSDGTSYQFEVLSDLADCSRVAVRSGHGIGKTTLDAWAALWWLITRPMSRVIIVAPEFSRQIRGIIFAEIRKWARRAKVKLPVEVLAHRVMVRGFGEEWSAIGVPSTETNRIEGFHSDAGVLLILDESKGIGQDVYDAMQGALSGLEDNRLLVTSTPGGVQGPFWRICTRGRELGWRLHHLPASDSSNVDPAWVKQRAAEWGLGSPLYQARVLGEFNDEGEGCLFPLSLLEVATNRPVSSESARGTLMGVDVARSVAGDLCCIAVTRDGIPARIVTWRSTDTMATVQRVVQMAAASHASVIRVDEGGVGAGVVDRLRQLGYNVEGVAFGGSASDTTRFRNRRAEMFFNLREAMEKGLASLPEDDELLADLSALRYRFDPSGKILLESKDDVRKRLGRSPDRGDAVALALGIGDPRKGQWAYHKVGFEGRIVNTLSASRMGHPQQYPSAY